MAQQALLIDPRIRDNVFLPMVALMFLVVYARFYLTKVLNRPSNPLLEKPCVSYKSLRGTLMQHKADTEKSKCINAESEAIDLMACFKKIKDDSKHGAAMTRSTRVRMYSNYLAEESLKQRKAFFTAKDTGYLN